ncbi:Vacuolar protein sorting-associated protein 64 [Spathaspora sp. JA1]|nr:Vacuolar protein sorting-associated protein 64 [Spathaspora sp. JA1]
MTDIPLALELTQEPFPNIDMKKNGVLYIKNKPNTNGSSNNDNTSKTSRTNGKSSSIKGRKRSNSQSQVISLPTKQTIKYTNTQQIVSPPKRSSIQYYVTLLPLNDTFIKKHLPVAIYPETTKLGRPTGTKHKPDVTNGYFDSRVLSRNHAQIYIDLQGKLMLQDLGSSNGTYLNDIRLNNDPVEIKVGDVICLGFNVQAESTHKQISLKIEKINIISNKEQLSSDQDGFDLVTNGLLSRYNELDSNDFKHLSFIEDIYRQQATTKKKKKTKSDFLTFDLALFGDINSNIEDNILGLYSNMNSGIYNNSQITNTTTLENIIKILVLNLSRIKQQNNSLITIITFLNNYQDKLQDLNRNYLSESFKQHLNKLQQDLIKQKEINNEVLLTKVNELTLVQDRLKSVERDRDGLIERYTGQIKQYEQINQDYFKKIESLEQECELLKQKLVQQEQEQEEPEEPESEIIAEKKQEDVEHEEVVEHEEPEDVNTAINGFIMDLSRTPSVTRKSHLEVDDNEVVSLTPPISGDEEDQSMQKSDKQPEHENEPKEESFNSNSTIDLLHSVEISNDYTNVEPFPKVDEKRAMIEEREEEQVDIKQVKAIVIAMSGVLIGYFIRRLTG